MANDYLVTCHQYVTRELKRAETLRQQAETSGDMLQAAFHAGQVEEYNALRQYMSRNKSQRQRTLSTLNQNLRNNPLLRTAHYQFCAQLKH